MACRVCDKNADRQQTEISGIRTPRPRQVGRHDVDTLSLTRKSDKLSSTSQQFPVALLILIPATAAAATAADDGGSGCCDILTALTLRRSAEIVFCFYLIYFQLLLYSHITIVPLPLGVYAACRWVFVRGNCSKNKMLNMHNSTSDG